MHITIEYIAGLFDGEGCITCNHTQSAPIIHLQVSNCNRPILEELKAFFGHGTIQTNGGGGDRPVYCWHTSGASKVTEVLTKLLPYLRIKQKQASIALKLCERIINRVGRAWPALTYEEYSLREGLAEEITRLNKGGT
jgi:hypothetical protein